ncbi:MAG TPA: hypothetical protein EYH04_01090 [Archaeoglobus profundus]|nr:hypothetical protein [Archaeoglobus profundus]
MKVKIGSFDEEYAKELADALKSIGVGVEIKRSIDVNFYPAYFVEGKFSELRNKYEETRLMDEIMRWKKFIDMARNVGSLNELEKKIYNELFGNKDVIEDKELLEFYYTLAILYDMLDANNAIEGDKIGNIPEDPIIKFPYNVDEDAANKLDLSRKLVSLAEVVYDVYVDLCDAIFERDKIIELCKKYKELIGVAILTGAIDNIVERIGNSRKIDIKELLNIKKIKLEELIEFRLSSDVIKAILDSLEEEGIVKVKKGKVSLTI